jgi:hypothetical protein
LKPEGLGRRIYEKRDSYVTPFGQLVIFTIFNDIGEGFNKPGYHTGKAHAHR